MSLSITSLTKTFGGQRAVDSISLEVAAGETLAILGPSGCGKSTLLALIAGLETPDAGDVSWEERSLAGVPTHRRGFGLMFQDYALFPHLNVAENVAFGLRLAGESASAPAGANKLAIRSRVGEMLALVGLTGFDSRDVHSLSGGEQQRVALARALAPRPRLLMLDEPLGSLDRALREQLTNDLRTILRAMGQTAIYVTHDQEEAFAIADRVALFERGRLAQIGSPAEVYRQPASVFVARFLGMNNLLPAIPRQRGQRWLLETPLGDIPWAGEGSPPGGGQPGLWLLRPEAARLDGSGPLQVSARLQETTFRGDRQRAAFSAHGQTLVFDLPANLRLPAVGQTLSLGFDAPQDGQFFPGQPNAGLPPSPPRPS